MFRIQSPSPMAYVERRLTPRRGDGGAQPARIHRERDFVDARAVQNIEHVNHTPMRDLSVRLNHRAQV